MDNDIIVANPPVVTYQLEGEIVDINGGAGIAELRIDLLDKDGLCSDLVATTRTDKYGKFSITLTSDYIESLFPGRIPTLAFRVYVLVSGEASFYQKFTDPTETWALSTSRARVRIALDLDEDLTVTLPTPSVVRGRVTDPDGTPVEGATVVAHDKFFTDEGWVGDTATNDDGWYYIEYHRLNRLQVDLIVRVFDAEDVEEEDPIAETEVMYHAPTTAIINLVQNNEAYRGQTEVIRMEHLITDMVVGASMAIAELTEEQVSYIASTKKADRHLVATYVKAAEIGADMSFPEGPIYVLLRQGAPQTATGILALRPETLRQMFKQASAVNIIPSNVDSEIDSVIDSLVQKAVEQASEAREGGGTSLGDVLALELSVTPEGEDPSDRDRFIQEFLNYQKTFAENGIDVLYDGTIDDFWQKLSDDEAFTNIGRLQRLVQLGALTRYHVPLVAELDSRWSLETNPWTNIRAVAQYDAAGWKGILDTEVESVAIGCPPDTPGEDDEERRTNFAAILERSVENAFPSAVIAARVIAADDDDDLTTFFTNNQDFDFATTRVSAYIAENGGAMTGVTEPEDATQKLQAMQRLFRLTRRYPEMKVLLDAGLQSSLDVHRMGRTRFIAQFTADLGAETAERIYDRAHWIASTAQALYTKYGSQSHSLPIHALPDLVTSAESPPAIIADWTTLFGSADACACKHCRSVHGPAAYLVDLLGFLERQNSELSTASGTPQYYSARDVLLGYFGTDTNEPTARRPDIAHLLLSCENTNTTLPYIDLVNEILEVAVADLVDDPDYSWPDGIESNQSAAELLAEPEIVHLEPRNVAYTELANAVHPFELPFHFWETEARRYLEHLGVKRHALLEAFLLPKEVEPETESPPNTDVAIANSIARERLGLSARAWDVLINELTLGLTSNEYWGVSDSGDWWDGAGRIEEVPKFLQQSGLSFDELREFLATDMNDAILLAPSDRCDIDNKLLTGLGETILGRTHRFLRLRKRLGLTVTETDWIMTSFGKTDIDAEFLRDVADALALQKDLGVPLAVLLSFWGPMGKRSYEGKTSLYEQLFLTKAITQLSDQFAVVADADDSGATILQLALPVMIALRIKLEELALLMVEDVSEAAMGLPNVIPDSALLSMANLSRLHRIVAFARALRVSISEYVILRELSGMNVLSDDDSGEPVAKPSGTRDFVTLLNKLRAAGLDVADVHYIVCHFEPLPAKIGITDEAVTRIVNDLEKLADDIAADDAAPDEPTTEHASSIHTRLDEAVPQMLAAKFKVDVAIMTQLLQHGLHSAVESSSGALIDFYHDSTATQGDREHLVARMHKAVMLVKRLKLDATQLDWLYRESESSWLDLDNLPYALDNTATNYRPRFAALVRLVEFAAVRDMLRGGGEALVAILGVAKEVADAEATEADFYDEIAARTDWGFEGSEIQALSKDHFGYEIVTEDPEDDPDFSDERALGNVLRALKMLHSLGITVTQGIAWSDLDVSFVDAAAVSTDIKIADRKTYSDDQWPTVVRPIRDGLREKQRDALVGYLISADDAINKPNDLFAKLLIDVEMSPCQLTSRIKQAISSVQTFVQRSLLGLEQDVKLNEEAAREWEWLKSYRVWEANRKVSYYPENWIEPELRDDKTPFFKTLENSLSQGELNNELAERAYLAYLDELHGVARLDIAAVCHQQELDDDCKNIDIVHVIGRTHAPPHRYYYRKRMDSSYWTPWEKMDLEIQGDHLLATVWNRRLYLIWPMFEERADDPQSSSGPVRKNWRVSLSWTAYESDGFGPIRTSKSYFSITHVDTKWLSFHVTKLGNELLVSCLLNQYGAGRYLSMPGLLRHVNTFGFQPCTGEWSIWNLPAEDIPVWAPAYSMTEFMRLVEHPELKPVLAAPNPSNPPSVPLSFFVGNGVLINILDKTPGIYSLLMDRTVENVTFATGPRDALFYIDATRTFFMEKYYELVASWHTPSMAYPNMPVRIARDAANGIDAELLEWANNPLLDMNVDVFGATPRYRFHSFYHPYVCEFTRRLARDGIDGLLRWSSDETPVQLLVKPDIEDIYEPTDYVVDQFPIENVDFSFEGTYSQYNWELFFHAPFLIATRLTKDGRYEEADRWYRYIFDPTGGAPGDGPERFWNVRPFRENIPLASQQPLVAEFSSDNPHAQELAALFGLAFESNTAIGIGAQIAKWREDPFNPYRIARMEIIAYQKAVVMKYVENLLAWGDSLFRRDTMESINEATQLYILASYVLGPRPRLIKTDDVESKTYAQLITSPTPIANPLVHIESIVPEPPAFGGCYSTGLGLPMMQAPYFCAPHNENILGLWDTVEDRLLKVRCCMNIDGVVRQLPLFEAPLDPGLLVKATAAGLDLGQVLADVYMPLPNYRFSVLLPKAVEFAGSVAAMGNALLSALEKRDGEALSKLRSTQEIDMLTRVRDVRRRQIDEANETLEGLRKSRAVIDERRRFYTEIEDQIPEELAQRSFAYEAMEYSKQAQAAQLVASVLKLVPQVALGTASFVELGGVQLAGVQELGALAFNSVASHSSAKASIAAIEAGYSRRSADWTLQKTLAEKELEQIDRQIVAAEIRLEIAQKELQNHDQSLRNAKEVDDYLRTKYTREELYEWLITTVKGVYFQAYKLAYDLAKRTQKAFQFELALPDTETFLAAAYWDTTTDGLLAGERLQHDLRRMDAAYLERNKREYEITKHVSLAEVDPTKLLMLRETGTCNIALPEAIFDLDWPGHYLRRIKSVSVSIPVVNPTYAGVNCKLTLVKSFVRKTDASSGDYPRSGDGDPRFMSYQVATQSIITSTAQQDGGSFELVFRDERYLPFEGAGADSEWEIKLDRKTNRFNPTDAKDVILHIRYTARDTMTASNNLSEAAIGALEADDGPVGYRLFSAKADFPGEWAVFTNPDDEAETRTLELPFAGKHFQPLRGETDLEITSVQVFAKRLNLGTGDLNATVCPPGAGPEDEEAEDITLEYELGTYGKLVHQAVPSSITEGIVADPADPWTLVVPADEVLFEGIVLLDDIWIVCTYKKLPEP